MHDRAALLERFETTLKNHVAHVLEVARSSPPGGGPQWQAITHQLGLPPLSTQERGRLAGERRHSKGAFSQEVEGAIGRLASQATDTLAAIQAGGGPSEDPQLRGRVKALEAKIASLASDHRRDYEAWLAPPKSTGAGVAGIFANARATAQISPWSQAKWDQRLTLSCAGCGAPQRTQLEFTCKYCGQNLFGPAPE